MYSRPSQNERQHFQDEYPSLTSVLLNWTVAYGREDEEVLSECLRDETPESLRRAVQQARKFLQQTQLPWTVIRDTANCAFLTERDAREWLAWIIDKVEAHLGAAEQHPPNLTSH